MELQARRGKLYKEQALINGTQDMIWSVDTRLRIITANNSFVEMINTLTGRMIGEGDSVLIEEFGDEQLVKWKQYYERALSGEQFAVKDHHYDPVKQSIEYSLISLSPIYDDENAIFGIACYSKDITADTVNTIALENTRARLEKILDFSLDMICSISEDGYILSVNAASEKILGYKPKELIGKPLFDFVYPEDLEKTQQMATGVMAGIDMTNNENRYVRKDGSLVPLTWSARWDPKEKVRYGIARDATEKKKSEEALIESEKKYKYLFEKNPLPIIIWDFETLQVVDCNEEAIKEYGYTREEFLQLTTRQLRPAEDIPLFEKMIKTEAAYGDIHKKVWRHTRKNGEVMYMDVTGHLMNYSGRLVSVSLSHDITESRYYHELDKLEKNILELKARSEKSIQELASIYLSGIEAIHPGMQCSILEKRGNRLFNLAAPGLPEKYMELIEGIEIGDNVGSCGTAVFLKQKVIVTDISNDVRWAAYKEIADKYQFKACWSYPIMGNNDNVIATFACYYREVKSPSEPEEHTIQRAGNILRVILESYQRKRALEISNERFEYATKAASDIIWDWNLETNEVYYSDNMKHLFGHKSGYTKDNLPFYFAHVHPDDRERVVLYPDQVKYGAMTNWTQEYRFKKADGEYAFILDRGIVIRDEKGTGVRMIGAMQDVTLIKQHELRVMQQNERLMEIALINAHEIRRPVASILGLMQLFNQDAARSETDKELLTHLETATRELDEVIRRIIDKTMG